MGRFNLPFLLLFFLAFMTAKAQTYELGLTIGGASYTGDLQPRYRITSNSPMAAIFVRENLNHASSLKSTVAFGKLKGSDSYNQDDGFAQGMRLADFSYFFAEGSVIFEYNFLNYKSEKNKTPVHWSPYFLAGLGVMGHSSTSKRKTAKYKNILPVIPFGIGFKYDMGRLFHLEWEFGIRKTFTDYLDNIGENTVDAPNDPTNYADRGNPNELDWYYFTGISLSYTFYEILCPYGYE